MTHESLNKQANWLFGIIVGLAIKEALTRVFPHFLSPQSGHLWDHLAEGARLFVFLIIIIRFYLGSVRFFEDAYLSPEAKEKYKKKSIGMDFLFGFVHFLIIFALALTIETHIGTDAQSLLIAKDYPLRAFEPILALVLIYDLIWFLACKGYDTRQLMKSWMVLNVITLVIAALAFSVTKLSTSAPLYPEQIAFIPILVISALDIAELVSEREIIVPWILGLFGQSKQTPPASESPQ